MKKVYLLLLFLAVLVVVISACTPKKISFCGNNICEDTENCQCSDCASTPECQQQLNPEEQCNDLNECTRDFYDNATKSCGHEFITNCCGNGKCESTERDCNLQTYTTNCPQDCKFNCPAHLIIIKSIESQTQDNFPYTCSENCKEISINNFELRNETGSLKTIIKNIGETTSSTITSSFYCYREGNPNNIAQRDNDIVNGISVKDYFDVNKDTVNIKSKVVGNNTATYYLNFDFTNIDQNSVTFICTPSLDDSADNFKNSQQISITFYK